MFHVVGSRIKAVLRTLVISVDVSLITGAGDGSLL